MVQVLRGHRPEVTTDERRLRDAGLRVTRARLATLAVLADPDGDRHLSVAALLTQVRALVPGTSMQTVYDNVEALTTAGLVRRVQLPGGPARFEARGEGRVDGVGGDDHHHLVCRQCGSTVDVPCTSGDAPCLQLPTDRGFTVEEAEVVFWGLCPDCTTARTHSPTSTPRTGTSTSERTVR